MLRLHRGVFGIQAIDTQTTRLRRKAGNMALVDEFGYKAVENRVSVNDLHATILHLMGIDHKRLTYRFNGRDYRLTDVAGEVIEALLA